MQIDTRVAGLHCFRRRWHSMAMMPLADQPQNAGKNKEACGMEEALNPKDLLFIGTFGHVKAIDKRTGEDRWQISLPATGYEIVSLFCEGFHVFAGSKGYVFALDARTGEILWTNHLSGLGHEDMSLAVQTVSAGPPPMPKPEENEYLDRPSEDSEAP